MQKRLIYVIMILFATFCFAQSKPEWKLVYLGNYQQIALSICCPDTNNCFILFDHEGFCQVVRSSDRGQTWKVIHDETQGVFQPLPHPHYVFEMQVPDTNHIYISYDESKIKISNDLCMSFDTVQLPYNTPISSLNYNFVESLFNVGLCKWNGDYE